MSRFHYLKRPAGNCGTNLPIGRSGHARRQCSRGVPVAGSEQRIQYYKDMAAAAMKHASTTATPEMKNTYIELAQSWNALADAATRFATDLPEMPSEVSESTEGSTPKSRGDDRFFQ